MIMATDGAQEKTAAQTTSGVSSSFGGGPAKLSKSSATYKTYRKMRRDPTIALARWIASAPIISAAWSYEATADAPEGAKEFIEKEFNSLRLHLLQRAVYGMTDFGWQPFEKVLQYMPDGKIGIRKLKPLLQDNTEIMVDEETGAFVGFVNGGVDLSVEESLLFSFEPEGTDWYGQSIMENAREPYDRSNALEGAAGRYDAKIAGTHIVVRYPLGKSPYNGGAMMDNEEIARRIVESIQSSGAIVIPKKMLAELNNDRQSKSTAWEIEFLTDNSAGRGAFTERQAYLDSQKVRAFGFPERSILEGQYGTKAEAEAHGDFAITCMELRHQDIVQTINWHCVNHLLRINYGQQYENTVYIKPAPINDSGKAFFRKLYETILANPESFLMETADIDMQAMRDRIGIPTKTSEPERMLPTPDADILPDPITPTTPVQPADNAEPLNGAQISSVVEVLTLVANRTLAELAAIELLVSVGMKRDKATAVVRAQVGQATATPIKPIAV